MTDDDIVIMAYTRKESSLILGLFCREATPEELIAELKRREGVRHIEAENEYNLRTYNLDKKTGLKIRMNDIINERDCPVEILIIPKQDKVVKG